MESWLGSLSLRVRQRPIKDKGIEGADDKAPLICLFRKEGKQMFDAKIQQIVDKFGETVDEKMTVMYDVLGDTVDRWSERYESLTWNMKVVIGISLGLSITDTILLFAILKKLGR